MNLKAKMHKLKCLRLRTELGLWTCLGVAQIKMILFVSHQQEDN
jgi:hypothetical protein